MCDGVCWCVDCRLSSGNRIKLFSVNQGLNILWFGVCSFASQLQNGCSSQEIRLNIRIMQTAYVNHHTHLKAESCHT